MSEKKSRGGEGEGVRRVGPICPMLCVALSWW